MFPSVGCCLQSLPFPFFSKSFKLKLSSKISHLVWSGPPQRPGWSCWVPGYGHGHSWSLCAPPTSWTTHWAEGGKETARERERGNGQREEMINEAGNELRAIITSESNCRRLRSISEEERLPFTSGGAERKPSGAGCTNWHLATAVALIKGTSFREEPR